MASDQSSNPIRAGLNIIAEYTRALGKHLSFRPLFRGHASSTWALQPSAFRTDAAGIENREQLLAWRQTAQRLISPQPANQLAYLVLAQHYGIATGLLDWTTNPLVALFFAAQKVEGRHDGVVLLIDASRFQTIRSPDTVDVFRERREQPLLLDTSAMNIRSAAQDSFMTLHTRGSQPPEATTIFTIQESEKWMVREALKMFGMAPERIYVDLTMAAQQFKELLELRQDLENITKYTGFSKGRVISGTTGRDLV